MPDISSDISLDFALSGYCDEFVIDAACDVYMMSIDGAPAIQYNAGGHDIFSPVAPGYPYLAYVNSTDSVYLVGDTAGSYIIPFPTV